MVNVCNDAKAIWKCLPATMAVVPYYCLLRWNSDWMQDFRVDWRTLGIFHRECTSLDWSYQRFVYVDKWTHIARTALWHLKLDRKRIENKIARAREIWEKIRTNFDVPFARIGPKCLMALYSRMGKHMKKSRTMKMLISHGITSFNFLLSNFFVIVAISLNALAPHWNRRTFDCVRSTLITRIYMKMLMSAHPIAHWFVWRNSFQIFSIYTNWKTI